MDERVSEFLHLLGATVGGARLPEGFSVGDGGTLFSLAEGQGLSGAIAPILKQNALLAEEALAPFLAAHSAALKPAGPPPQTTTSYCASTAHSILNSIVFPLLISE